jgi:hypothetical protein
MRINRKVRHTRVCSFYVRLFFILETSISKVNPNPTLASKQALILYPALVVAVDAPLSLVMLFLALPIPLRPPPSGNLRLPDGIGASPCSGTNPGKLCRRLPSSRESTAKLTPEPLGDTKCRSVAFLPTGSAASCESGGFGLRRGTVLFSLFSSSEASVSVTADDSVADRLSSLGCHSICSLKGFLRRSISAACLAFSPRAMYSSLKSGAANRQLGAERKERRPSGVLTNDAKLLSHGLMKTIYRGARIW